MLRKLKLRNLKGEKLEGLRIRMVVNIFIKLGIM